MILHVSLFPTFIYQTSLAIRLPKRVGGNSLQADTEPFQTPSVAVLLRFFLQAEPRILLANEREAKTQDLTVEANIELHEIATLFELYYHTRAFLFMSSELPLLTAVRLYASHTDDVVVKIDENTSQIKGKITTMQSDASRIDARLQVLQRAVKKLERHLDDQEREELLGEGKAQEEQDVNGNDSSSAAIQPGCNRMSVASYNTSLRRSLRDLNSIISSSSAMSRMSSLFISAIPESPEMDNSHFGEQPSQKSSLASAQEVDGTLEDDEQYRAFIEKTLAGLKVDEESESESELSTMSSLEESSPALGDLDDGCFDHRIDFDQTSEGYDWDSEAANLPAIRSWVALDSLRPSPRPSSYLQDPKSPPLPPALHREQVSESAIETIRRPEPPAPAIVPVSDSMSLVLVDLKNRVEDWRGHNPETFGNLILHEVLLITRPINPNRTKNYHIYLFESIILCCGASSPKTKKGFWRSKKSDKSGLEASQLRLNGRIFMRNVKNVVAHSKDGKHSMQVFWSIDHNEENFSIYFNDADTMRTWIWHINLQSKASHPLIENPYGEF